MTKKITIDQVKERLADIFTTEEKIAEEKKLLYEAVQEYLQANNLEELMISETAKLKLSQSTTYSFKPDNFIEVLTPEQVMQCAEKLDRTKLEMVARGMATKSATDQKLIGEKAAAFIKQETERIVSTVMTVKKSPYLRKSNIKPKK